MSEPNIFPILAICLLVICLLAFVVVVFTIRVIAMALGFHKETIEEKNNYRIVTNGDWFKVEYKLFGLFWITSNIVEPSTNIHQVETDLAHELGKFKLYDGPWKVVK